MTTPTGMRARAFKLNSGHQIMVYSDAEHLFLQLRHEVPTEQDILAPSIKAAVSLTTDEALGLVTELLEVVNNRARKQASPGENIEKQ